VDVKNYTVHQAKSQLSKLIQKALQGEEIIITNRKKPVARITAIKPLKRKLGFLGKGGWISPDFNDTPKEFRDYL
jgi:prevent-host-death family protein